MCANDHLPLLQKELELICGAANCGKPVLGSALGAQLIAKALGGTVYQSAVRETGWQDVHLEECALRDPVFRATGVQFPPEMTAPMVAEWSRESGLPESAETPDACANLAQTCDRLMTGWSGLL